MTPLGNGPLDLTSVLIEMRESDSQSTSKVDTPVTYALAIEGGCEVNDRVDGLRAAVLCVADQVVSREHSGSRVLVIDGERRGRLEVGVGVAQAKVTVKQDVERHPPEGGHLLKAGV